MTGLDQRISGGEPTVEDRGDRVTLYPRRLPRDVLDAVLAVLSLAPHSPIPLLVFVLAIGLHGSPLIAAMYLVVTVLVYVGCFFPLTIWKLHLGRDGVHFQRWRSATFVPWAAVVKVGQVGRLKALINRLFLPRLDSLTPSL